MMFRKLVVVLSLVLPAVVLQTAVAAEQLPPVSRWISQDAILVVELSQPKDLLDLALDSKLSAAVTSLPVYAELTSRPGFKQFELIVKSLEAQVGTDWKTGVPKLLGGGVTFAVGLDGTFLLSVDTEDAQLLEKLHDVLLLTARGQAAQRGHPEEVASGEYRGEMGWTFSKDEAHVIIGNRLMVSNRPEALKAALDLRAEPQRPSLATLPAYQAAKQAAGADATATVFVNLEVVKQIPDVQAALTQSTNPLASLLFTGIIEAVRGSSWLSLGFSVEGEKLVLEATVDGKAVDPSGPAAFALFDEPGEGALPNLSVPRRIAAMSFFRDLHKFYAAKDELFPERTSGLIFFENMMGIFFSGRDLTEEVLGETTPEFRFVVAEQEYDPEIGTPRVQFPAFALILGMRNPEQFGEVAEEAWQKAVGLVNFSSGQNAQPGLIIDRPFHGDTQLTMTYYSSSNVEDRTNIESRFNFRPALVRLGDHLILSSTDGLAGDLIDALKKEKAESVKPLAETHSLVEIDGPQLASILNANLENLVRQNMVSDGNTRQQAETQMGLIMMVLKYFGRAELKLGSKEGRPQASLEIELKVP